MKSDSDGSAVSLDDLLDRGSARQQPPGKPRSGRRTGCHRRDRPSPSSAPQGGRRFGSVSAGAVLLVLLAAALWWVTGGRWQSVATPSMGQAAPVGTLVLTRPVTTAQVHVGDIVTFRSPITDETYTHRVIDIDPSGGLHSKGDINGAADPAVLHDKDLVGKVVARWWGIGWLLKALPLLLIGGLLIWYTTRRWVLPDRRLPVRMLGSSILVSITSLLLKPLVNFVVVVDLPSEGHTDLTLVSTGIFPIRVNATGGAHLDLVDGQIGALRATGDPGSHGYQLTSAVHLTVIWWLVLIIIWLTPLMLGLLFASVGPRLSDGPWGPDDDVPAAPSTAGTAEAVTVPAGGNRRRHLAGLTAVDLVQQPFTHRVHGERSPHRHRRPATVRRPRRLVAGLGVLVAVVAGLVPSTHSAFAAKVTNSVNTAASNPYFTCRAALTSTTGLSTSFAYPLGEKAFTTAADVSGNGRNGTYSGTWTSTPAGRCPRDTTSTAVTSGGSNTAMNYISNSYAVSNPNTFTIGVWFKTTGNTGGRLMGFGNQSTGTSSQYDRHLFMTDNGQVVFGVYPNTVKVITSPQDYDDGTWHEAVATLSTSGMKLYVDGQLVASDSSTTTAENHAGYWRVGYDNVNGWTNQPSNFNYRGSLAWPFVCNTTALTANQIQQLYIAGS